MFLMSRLTGVCFPKRFFLLDSYFSDETLAAFNATFPDTTNITKEALFKFIQEHFLEPSANKCGTSSC